MKPPRTSRSPAIPVWTGAVVFLALTLGLPGAARNFRPGEGLPDPATLGLPEPLEPEGELEEPPRVFRWTPGGEDVAFSQVVIYRSTFERLWESPPLRGDSYELDPDRAFVGIPAGEECVWRVREISGGRPRAASRSVPFTFRKDHRGFAADEAPPESRPLFD
jgi:hypothetical protein